MDVKRIKVCGRDTANLERLLAARGVVAHQQPESYRNKVVLKPWGHEFLVFENESVAVWFLNIKTGHSTSMHCHPKKKTSLVLLSGEALCGTFSKQVHLRGMDAVIFESGVFHSTKAMSEAGIRLIEIETPPAKTDLIRLNDEYGRQSSGYEGLSEMRTESLGQFEYFFFEGEGRHGDRLENSSHYIELLVFENNRDFQANSKFVDGDFYCVCSGTILDRTGEVFLKTGEVDSGQKLRLAPPLSIAEKTVIMRFQRRL